MASPTLNTDQGAFKQNGASLQENTVDHDSVVTGHIDDSAESGDSDKIGIIMETILGKGPVSDCIKEEDIPVSEECVVDCSGSTELLSTSPKQYLNEFNSGQDCMFSFPPTPDQSPKDHLFRTCLTTDREIPIVKHVLNIKTETPASPLTISFSSTVDTQNSTVLSNSSGICMDSIEQLFSDSQSLQTVTSSNTAKPAVKTLKFPPCSVCGGKASGLHYGINSCEACKGFFRRYLLRNEEYKCTKGGQCEIINRNRGNCSGCRLQKCLVLGMAKEKSRLGRYTLARRTQTIKEVNKLEGKEEIDSEAGNMNIPDYNCDDRSTGHFQALNQQCGSFDPNKEMICRKLNSKDFIPDSVPFSETLVESLVTAMDEIKPFGLAITTNEQLQSALKDQYDKYNLKIKMYGQMKSVPKEEFKRLYKDFGMDVDGRMKMLRKSAQELEGMIERYCMFAKHIPDFRSLSCRDQSNLLKASRCDFFMILMSEGYSEEYQVFISHSGCAYHIEEAADKFFSRKLITTVCDMYRRWQLLQLSKAEKALLIALTLVFTDRCNLDNHDFVEKIQLSLVELLRNQLKKTCKESSQKRFAKIISYLTLMRESSEMYLKEYKELCNDEIVVEEVPMMTEFLLEDW